MQIIHAKQVLTPEGWQEDRQIELSTDGRISWIGAQMTPPTDRVDLLLPAPANLHSHAFQRAMAGLTERRGPDARDSFWTWRRLMYRFLDRLTPDHVEAIAEQVFVEMLETGYAAVAEFHYLHHDFAGLPFANIAEMSERIVAAARATGIGLTLLPVLYQHGGCDGRALAGGQLRFGNDPERFARLHQGAAQALAAGFDDYVLGVAPHSLRAVDGPGLAAAVALAPGGPVHIHIAEQPREVDEVHARLGARPLRWLLDNHAPDARWCLIHCTQADAGEIAGLARSGAVAGLCPITEANLGDGIFAATELARAGGRFAVGSDSNVEITLFGELRLLDYTQRLRDHSRAALAEAGGSAGRALFDQAARHGAQAAGRDAGAIAPGQFADLLGIETGNPWLADRRGDTALDSLIFGCKGGRCIRDVWAAGRHVVSAGRHARRDIVATRFRAALDDLGATI